MRRAMAVMVMVASLAASGLPAADEPAGARLADQAALKPYGPLVGTWRGTGQPQRGRSAGAWTESASWAWKLSNDSAALAIDVEKGKFLKAAMLGPGKEAGAFVLEATLADGSKRAFRGKAAAPGKPLVLAAEGPGEGLRRITLSVPNDLRFLLLLESEAAAGSFARLGEVGFTRNGVSFAAGEAGPVCVVTGGRGTMAVSYQGKTYQVCCSGCRDLFNENPAAIIAEAEAQARKPK